MPDKHCRPRWFAAAAMTVAVSLTLSACGQASPTPAKNPDPAKVEQIGDSGMKRLTLTAKAVERLAIRTAPVIEVPGGKNQSVRKIIPYSALLYLSSGQTVTYTNPEGLSYVRQNVAVESIKGDMAVLIDGPPAGTAVVTVGATELWGTEFGVK